jgi:hypothetical protein
MLRWLFLSLLVLVSQAVAEYRTWECRDTLRPEIATYFGDELRGCKFRICPYWTGTPGGSDGAWFLMLDDVDYFVESATFDLDSTRLTYERTPTPSLVCYDYKGLSLRNVAWIAVDSVLFEQTATVRKGFVTLDLGEESPHKVKFPEKAQRDLQAFRTAVLTRIATAQSVAILKAEPKPDCDPTARDSADSTAKHPDCKAEIWGRLAKQIPDSTGPEFKVGVCLLRGPSGKHWKVASDASTGTLVIERRNDEDMEKVTGLLSGFNRITVFQSAPDRSARSLNLDRMADDFRTSQEATMLTEGVQKHIYELVQVEKGTTCVNGKRMYYFAYRAEHPVNTSYNYNVIYLCFPPDYATTRMYYGFSYAAAIGYSRLGVAIAEEGLNDFWRVLRSVRFAGN